MPAGYEKIRDSLIRQGMSADDAKTKAARIWNSKHKGDEAVGRHYDEKNMNALQKITQLAAEIPDVVELEWTTGAKVGIGAAGVAAGAGAVGGYMGIRHHFKKQKEWRDKAGPNDLLKIGHDLYIDKHGAMFPQNHPKVQKGKVSEL